MFGKTLILLSVSLISGWFGSDLDIKIRFDRIDGLKTGAPVLFEKKAIGKVTHVSCEKDGTFRVNVTIGDDFKNAATEDSRFFIVEHPSQPDTKAVEMIRIKGEGRPLQNGAVVKGVTKLSALLEGLEQGMTGAVEELKERFREFSKELKETPQREDMRKLYKDLERLLEEIKRSGAAIGDQIRKDLIPRLQEQMDKLRERPQEPDKEKGVEPLQTRMDEMRNT